MVEFVIVEFVTVEKNTVELLIVELITVERSTFELLILSFAKAPVAKTVVTIKTVIANVVNFVNDPFIYNHQ